MAKQAAGTHQPLGYRDHIRLRALHKNLHSKFQAVRVAAAKEIQAILHKKRGLQNWLREWAVKTRNAAVRKVTPEQLRGPLRVKARAQDGSRQKREAPVPAGQWRRHQPLTDHVLTRAELKQRTKDAKAAARSRGGSAGVPAGPGPVMPAMPAHLTDEAIQKRWQGAWDDGVREGRERAQQPGRPRRTDAMQQAQDAMRQAHQQPQPGTRASSQPGGHVPDVSDKQRAQWNAETMQARQQDAAARAARNGQQPKRAPQPTGREKFKAAAAPIRDVTRNPGSEYGPAAPAHAKVPPLPGDPEARLQPGEKRRWARLPKRGGDAPERTRSGRSRTRTTA
jgi:hypothetical protein